MADNRYYGVRVEGAKYGVSFGSALAIAIWASSSWLFASRRGCHRQRIAEQASKTWTKENRFCGD